jgi:hypothetical protein
MIKSISILKTSGRLGFIVPNTFCDLENCNDFRHWFLTENSVLQFYQTGWAFKDAIVDTIVFILEKNKFQPDASVSILIDGRKYQRSIDQFLQNELYKIDYRNDSESLQLLNKLNNLPPLSRFAIVKAGVKMYEKGKGNPQQSERIIKERPYSSNERKVGWRSLYRGQDIKRYSLAKEKEYVNYGPWLAAPRTEILFEGPKILMRRTDDILKSCIDTSNSICVNSCHVIKLNEAGLKYIDYNFLLGLLNSRLLQKIFELQNPQMIGKIFSEIKVIYVERLPIKIIDSTNQSEKSLHDSIVHLVETMLQLQKEKQQTNLPDKLNQLEARIKYTDDKINQLVFELYGLSEEEVKLIV